MDKKIPEKGKKSSGIGGEYTRLGLRIAADFGATIAVPVVLFAWLGKYLDGKYGTTPWLMVLGFALAALISIYSIRRKAKKYGEEFQKMD